MLWLRAILLLTCLTSLWSGPPEQPRASEHGAAFVLVVGQMADRVVAVIGMVSIQSFDAETGLVYLRNRYYEPDLGCFTQVDPARAGNNWHGYCDGDPVNKWDPNGLDRIRVENGFVYYDKDKSNGQVVDSVMVGIQKPIDDNQHIILPTIVPIRRHQELLSLSTDDIEQLNQFLSDKHSGDSWNILSTLGLAQMYIGAYAEKADRFKNWQPVALAVARGLTDRVARYEQMKRLSQTGIAEPDPSKNVDQNVFPMPPYGRLVVRYKNNLGRTSADTNAMALIFEPTTEYEGTTAHFLGIDALQYFPTNDLRDESGRQAAPSWTEKTGQGLFYSNSKSMFGRVIYNFDPRQKSFVFYYDMVHDKKLNRKTHRLGAHMQFIQVALRGKDIDYRENVGWIGVKINLGYGDVSGGERFNATRSIPRISLAYWGYGMRPHGLGKLEELAKMTEGDNPSVFAGAEMPSELDYDQYTLELANMIKEQFE